MPRLPLPLSRYSLQLQGSCGLTLHQHRMGNHGSIAKPWPVQKQKGGWSSSEDFGFTGCYCLNNTNLRLLIIPHVPLFVDAAQCAIFLEDIKGLVNLCLEGFCFGVVFVKGNNIVIQKDWDTN